MERLEWLGVLAKQVLSQLSYTPTVAGPINSKACAAVREHRNVAFALLALVAELGRILRMRWAAMNLRAERDFAWGRPNFRGRCTELEAIRTEPANAGMEISMEQNVGERRPKSCSSFLSWNASNERRSGLPVGRLG
jgi:hypothetical protein